MLSDTAVTHVAPASCRAVHRALACVLLFVWACSGSERSTPSVFSIEPNRVTSLVDTPATLRGSHFDDATAALDLSSNTAPRVERKWQIELEGGAAPLEATRADSKTLHFTIPAGIAPGTYAVTVIAPASVKTLLPGALTVSDAPIGLPLSIESSADGNGEVVGDRELVAGQSLALYAVFRTSEGAFITSDRAVTWSVTGDDAKLSETDAAATSFISEHTGTSVVSAAHEEFGQVNTGSLRIGPAEASALRIEDAPGGTGHAFEDSRAYTTDDTVTVYAVSRDRFGNFVSDEVVDWTLIGEIGVVTASANSLTIDLTRPGSGHVTASHALGTTETGAFNVSPGRAAMLSAMPDMLMLTAGAPAVALTVVARDADGNETSDLGDVTWQIIEGPIATLDAMTGVFQATLAGDGRVQVASSYGPSTDIGIQVRPGRATSLALQPSSVSYVAGANDIALTVTGTDAFGNPTTDLGNLTFSLGSGSLSASDLDASRGVLSPRQAGAGTITVTSSYGVLTQSPVLTVVPGRAVTLNVSPTSATLSADDAPLAFALTGVDPFGNVTADLGQITWAVASGSLSALDAVSGVLDPMLAGSGTVRASSSYGATADTSTVSIAPGRAASLQVAPSMLSLSADAAPVTFTATGHDADGNLTADLGTLTWSIASGAITAVDPTSGVLDPKVAGTGSVRATSSYGTAATSGAIVIEPGRATRLVIAPDILSITADSAPVTFTTAGYDADDNFTTDVGTLSYGIASGSISQLDPTQGTLDPKLAGTGTVRVASSYGVTDDSGSITISPGHAATLSVSPSTLTTHVGAAPTQFVATGQDADGNVTMDLGALAFGIGSGSFATLDAAGLLTPTAEGSGVVHVASAYGPVTDSSTILVKPAPPPVQITGIVAPANVTRGQGGVSIAVTVTNAATDRDALVSSVWLELLRGGVSVASEYTIVADSKNPIRIGPSSQATYLFYLDVATTATTGTVELNGRLDGFMIGRGVIEHAAATTFQVSSTLAPVAIISHPKPPEDRVCLGGSIAFNGSTSTGTGLTYAWKFAGGSPATSSAAAPAAVSYAAAGNYDYELTVTNATGQKDTARGAGPVFVGTSEGVISATYPTGRAVFKQPTPGELINLGHLPADDVLKLSDTMDTELRQCNGTVVNAMGNRYVTVWMDRGVIDPTEDDRPALPGIQLDLDHGGTFFEKIKVLNNTPPLEGPAMVYAEYYNSTLGVVTAAGYQLFQMDNDGTAPAMTVSLPATDCGNCYGIGWPFVFQFSEPIDPATLSGLAVQYKATLSCATTGFTDVTSSSSWSYDAAARALYVRPAEFSGNYTIRVVMSGVRDASSNANALPVTSRCVFLSAMPAPATPAEPSVVSVSADPFSPDGDGASDTTQLVALVDGATRVVQLRLTRGASDVTTLLQFVSGAGNAVFTWDGRDSTGRSVPDGFYRYELIANNARGDASPSTSGVIEVDSAVRFVGVPSRY